MQALTRAHHELFRRGPDERFESLPALWEHCHKQRECSKDFWAPPQHVRAHVESQNLTLSFCGERPFAMNDWSFSQLCRLAGVSKETLNRLTPETAGTVLEETLPSSERPVQILASGDVVRSIHGVAYTRLWDVDIVTMIREFASGFTPPPIATGGGTGLYAGEQDMFLFLIDPTGWVEVEGEAFAPGFFVWNSEVGRRSVGMQTFWFQSVCQNHIVWDVIDVAEFNRKHTANVHESLVEMRRMIERLVETRDARRDGFAKLIKKAAETKLGANVDEVLKVLDGYDIARKLAKEAIKLAQQRGRFTILNVVDGLTRLSGDRAHAAERTDLDEKAGRLLALASAA